MGQFSDYVATLSSAIPSSLYVLRKGMSDQTTFVVCPNCDKLYRFTDCVDHSGGWQSSKKCTFVCYPDHPHLNSRAPCGCIYTTENSYAVFWYKNVVPYMKTYPYTPLFTFLRDLQEVKSCKLSVLLLSSSHAKTRLISYMHIPCQYKRSALCSNLQLATGAHIPQSTISLHDARHSYALGAHLLLPVHFYDNRNFLPC